MGTNILNMNANVNLVSNRECGECTACCEGWLSASIYGHIMKPGVKCHFLGKTCSIYDNRPVDICKTFKCAWLDDKNHFIPEWIKPSLSKIIIVNRKWGNDKEYDYWSVVECGQKIDSEILNWLITFCENNKICVEYQLNGKVFLRGTPEFGEFMVNKNRNVQGEIS